MKKQIIVLVIIIIVAAVGAYLVVRHQGAQLSNQVPNYQSNYSSNSASNANQQSNSPAPTAPSDSVAVSTQRAGNEVDIDQVKLSQPGFIEIHEVVDGKPGKIIGGSKLLPAGTRQDVIIKVAIVAGKSYIAMLHVDDGDGKFDAKKDLPLMNNGQMVMAKFTVAK